MPGSASSSSLDAVLIFTAASANAENSSVAISSKDRSMFSPWVDERRDSPRRKGAMAALAIVRTMLRRRSSAGKQPTHVARHALLDREHRRPVPSCAQPRHIGLGEALVLAREVGRE